MIIYVCVFLCNFYLYSHVGYFCVVSYIYIDIHKHIYIFNNIIPITVLAICFNSKLVLLTISSSDTPPTPWHSLA